MANAIIKLEYEDGTYEIHRRKFDSLRDVEVYTRIARMQRAREEIRNAKLPFNRAKKLYRDLLSAGIVQRGQIITNAEAKELSKKLAMLSEPQYLF